MARAVRRWAVDWLAGRNPAVCEEILAEEYVIHIGGVSIEGRSAYVRSTLAQLDRFPGLGLTVHELIVSGEHAAVRFTEHGGDIRTGGTPAAWRGVALFRGEGDRLSTCWAEEDYLGRRRQLRLGTADPVEPPAVAPWNVTPLAADPRAEAAVRTWLAAGTPGDEVVCDAGGAEDGPVSLNEPVAELDALFSAGERVAFHGRLRGRYAGGIAEADGGHRDAAVMYLAGIVEVRDGQVVGGRLVRDRLGTVRALQRAGR